MAYPRAVGRGNFAQERVRARRAATPGSADAEMQAMMGVFRANPFASHDGLSARPIPADSGGSSSDGVGPDEGVLLSHEDANIGYIFGIGFPPWTGGAIQYIKGYEGGVDGFIARSQELAAKYGERFNPPARLKEIVEG